MRRAACAVPRAPRIIHLAPFAVFAVPPAVPPARSPQKLMASVALSMAAKAMRRVELGIWSTTASAPTQATVPPSPSIAEAKGSAAE